MNYLEVIDSNSDEKIRAALRNAIAKLFATDLYLLREDAKEETVAHKLAEYLASYFDGLDVDVEYNRMGPHPKRVTWNERPDLVYPDIIVHKRGTSYNHLAIELKKESNPELKGADIQKLKAYRAELEYQHALFIRFGVKANAGKVTECEWIF